MALTINRPICECDLTDLPLADDEDRSRVRRDIYAVFQFQDCGAGGAWCLVAAFKTLDSAKLCRRRLFADQLRPGGQFPLVRPKLANPRQWQLEAYVAFGNPIEL
jgi:hypothetical protein